MLTDPKSHHHLETKPDYSYSTMARLDFKGPSASSPCWYEANHAAPSWLKAVAVFLQWVRLQWVRLQWVAHFCFTGHLLEQIHWLSQDSPAGG